MQLVSLTIYTTEYIRNDSPVAWISRPAVAIQQLLVQGCTCSMHVVLIGASLLITCVMLNAFYSAGRRSLIIAQSGSVSNLFGIV